MTARSEVDLPPETAAGQAFTELILTIFRVNGRLLEAAETMARAGGLTAARWQVLGGVLDQPHSVAEIGRRMGLTRQSVQRLANILVDEGFATWEPNPAHRRAKLLAPTDAAFRAIRSIAAVQHPWAAAVGAEVGIRRLTGASDTLARVLTEIDRRGNPG